MKIIILTFSILLITSCTSSSTTYKEQQVETTNWHTWNARYVTKTVDGNVTCYSHSEGGIQCFKITK